MPVSWTSRKSYARAEDKLSEAEDRNSELRQENDDLRRQLAAERDPALKPLSFIAGDVGQVAAMPLSKASISAIRPATAS